MSGHKVYFSYGDDVFRLTGDVPVPMRKWTHTTWRTEIESGRKSWHDYGEYRRECKDSEDMECAGLDDTWSYIETPMRFKVKSSGEVQAYITINGEE